LPAIAETLHQRIPNARKMVMARVGHMSNMEAPERFNALVSDFLAAQQRTA
jgi:pimeloyl-ACP methyl ester carboxylesterase